MTCWLMDWMLSPKIFMICYCWESSYSVSQIINKSKGVKDAVNMLVDRLLQSSLSLGNLFFHRMFDYQLKYDVFKLCKWSVLSVIANTEQYAENNNNKAGCWLTPVQGLLVIKRRQNCSMLFPFSNLLTRVKLILQTIKPEDYRFSNWFSP